MKKYLIIGALLIAPMWAEAARQNVTQISGTQSSVGALKSQVNTRLDATNDNFVELYTDKADATCFADSTSFNTCFGLNWPADGLSTLPTASGQTLLATGENAYGWSDTVQLSASPPIYLNPTTGVVSLLSSGLASGQTWVWNGTAFAAGSTSGGASVTVQSADPTSASPVGWYAATGSGDIFYKSSSGLFTIAGSYAADPAPSDSCSGALVVSAHFENSDTITTGGGCAASGVDTTFTRDANCTYANTTPSPDGGYYMDCTGTSSVDTHKAKIDSTNLPVSTGTVCMYWYPVDSQGANARPFVFDAIGEISLLASWQSGTSNYRIDATHTDLTKNDPSNLVSRGSWVRICSSWDTTPEAGGRKLAVKVGSNAWLERTDLSVTDPTVSVFGIGGPYSALVRGYVDGLKIYNTYKAE